VSGERVLVAGWINSPHVVAWCDALVALGYEVHLAGQEVERWPPAPDPPRFASVTSLAPGSVPGIRDRRLGRALAGVARDIKPDLVHAHWAPGYGWMAAKAGLRPLVTSAWGSDLLLASRRLMRRSRRAVRASDLVLADSAPLADAARRIAGPGVPVELVQWGVDLDRYRPDPQARAAARRALGVDANPVILSTRALDALYNPSVVLEAFGLLRRRVPDAQLVLKHPGAVLPTAIEAQLTDLGLREATHVIGFVDDEALAGLYRAADAYLSIPSSDSSPRSVWEALACGTPAVVSDLPWARQVLRDGEHALLVPVDAEAVAAALERVISEPGTATALAQAGLALTLATMNRRDHLARLKTLYGEVLG
jgi:glycosyltransferase involved in cell wall biosynthesis